MDYSDHGTPGRLLVLIGALGVAGLTSAASLTAQAVRFEKLIQLPDPPGNDAAFHLVAGAIRTSDGKLIVLDRFANSVRVFRTDGTLEREFGREGAGPGEIGTPHDVRIVGSDIVVVDAGNRRLTWFDLAGNYKRDQEWPARDPRYRETIKQIVPLTGGSVIVETAIAYGFVGGTEAYAQDRVVLYSENYTKSVVLATYPSGHAYATTRRDPTFTMSAGAFFGAGGVVAVLGDTIVAIVDGYRGNVRYLKIANGDAIESRARNLQWGAIAGVGEPAGR